MATRSLIACQSPDGVVRLIHCHWGGYLEYNGVLLRRYYSDPATLERLIALGDLSELGVQIGEAHDWRTHATDPLHSKWCLADHRDKGEALRIIQTHAGGLWDIAERADAEFLYLFQAGSWRVAERTGGYWGDLLPVGEALEAERRRALGLAEDGW